ncbi:DEHA2D17248p [Debaryomyces hansenii CBS767]|uniref:Acyl-coenzyme A oxidase n=1 Tax=Debaryomyces hansenii (strain ATCC 36239 / CBS 767 / BCRC 21394 / JCM 1990 / NBRC 0083 / IGC 2968) TaxID=284592 RepID=ACOX_DEBHA|nr:DEHA2D17248p [Debaryomyces hansenii CBS767]Q6BRD5.2 RecName: Full=Acyl-coenzyme A oxidase; Short=Acyl-CoA oxidase [Debaryomyces hansenii CBS767]CAG87407.2 DEHA2D17248p [Debaryomyces hansenii CBS767]|eukprot:XP_459235.2 DEHA2D17248p [Debaryomyces hansenii CBS767]
MVSATNTVNSGVPPNPAASIQAERAASKFDPKEMHYFLEGGEERAEKFKQMMQQMERDPILSANFQYYDLTKDQQRELTALRIDRLTRYIENESFDDFNKRMSLMGVFDPQLSTRLGINLGLFVSCLKGNGTAEQVKYWAMDKSAVYMRGIYGCFGMTELAHGSNVAGLETTATFDDENDEFIINTPHIGATKWWIGGAAHSATHCSVYARLIVGGQDYGVKTFVVPLRDSNHDTMPGVTVGDIGAKMGRDGIDNGWIQFSNVRIPRYFMLQKFCKVSSEGDVQLPPLEQLSYSALLGGRVMMVLDSFRVSARFSTVALRYAIGRRQFKAGSASDDKNALECQLLDYPLHQRRLLPYLALSYIISASAVKIETTIESTLENLDKAVEADDMGAIMKSIDSMKSLFVDSGSLKSTCTWLAAEVIDQCRQACGGHGYSAYSGFGKAYNDWVVMCTWEGDNNVLAMSVGKQIIKHILGVLDGKKVKGSADFLNNTEQYLNEEPVLRSVDDLKDLKKVLLAIEVAIIRVAYQASQTLKENKGDFDTVGAEMVTLSKLNAHHFMLSEFLDRMDSFESKQLVPYLESVAKLYSATIVLEKFAGDFLAQGVFPPKLNGELNSKHIPELCKEIRPNVIALTDSFQQSDMMINSAIGSYDGNIYENYFGVVKANNPPSKTKAPYSGALEAMLNRPSKEERERFEKSTETAKILSK